MIHRRLLQLAGALPSAILAQALVGIAISALHLVFAIIAASVIAALVNGNGDLMPALALLAAVTLVRGQRSGRESLSPPGLAPRCGSGCAGACSTASLPYRSPNGIPGTQPQR